MFSVPRAVLPLLVLLCAACAGGGPTTSSPPPASQLVKSPLAARRGYRSPRQASLAAVPPGPAPSPARAVSLPLHVQPPLPDPRAKRVFLGNVVKPAPRLLTNERPPRVLALGLDATARGEALGLRADGLTDSAVLAEGETARLPVALPPNSCVTYIAQGGLGVVEADLFLTTLQDVVIRVLAEDVRVGSIAVIGGKEGCFQVKGPVQGELHVQVRKGEGQVLVRRYRR